MSSMKTRKLQNHLIQLREDEAEAEENILRVQSKKRKFIENSWPQIYRVYLKDSSL